MKLLNAPIDLLFNYHEPILKNGIVRLILEGADQPQAFATFAIFV
jgi:hypothetical protein